MCTREYYSAKKQDKELIRGMTQKNAENMLRWVSLGMGVLEDQREVGRGQWVTGFFSGQ